jgi:hypothetical protein
MNRNSTNDRNPIRPLLAQANGVLASPNGFNPTPTTRNGSGHHRGSGKPTDGDGQWLLQPGGKLPPRAFQVHPAERGIFWRMVHALPLNGKEDSEAQRVGGEVFGGIFGAEGKKFELEIAAGRMEVERLSVEKARLESDLKTIPATVVQEPPVPQFPKLFSVPWWKFAACFILFCISCGAAVANISNVYLPSVQSKFLAIVVACPWVLAAIAAKLLTRGSQARTLTTIRWTVAAIGLVGIVMWLVGMCPLAAGLDFNNLGGGNVLLPDRRLAFVGQLLCEFAAGYLLISGMLESLTYQPVIVQNPNRIRIAGCVAEVGRHLDQVLQKLHQPEGNLTEWQASCSSFIQEGLTILHLRREDAAFLAEIQRQRADKQRLLSAFNS